ncbi:hypothetical protein CHS0354_033513 [Potamilus streckersoni]|uniref:dCMP deaminase n=1 Tax=Potamilus streckersoni TaxID=2493646 RepID=A0AAE0SAY7_9BIVA|nr:hypothetical protein CHS0354_033513 [Potamilus streckersoni]
MSPKRKGMNTVNQSKDSTRSCGKKKTTAKTKKIKDVIDWDQYFMGVALISAQRSKDPETQVGACIVNSNKRIVGIGYNGMPDQGILGNDKIFPWKKVPKEHSKHLYVCHAEMNAIVNKMSVDIRCCTIYTTLYPCNECSKLMIQSGISSVVYLEDKGFTRPEYAASKLLLDKADVKYCKYKPKGDTERLLKALGKL